MTNRRDNPLFHIFAYIILIIGAIVMVFPMIWMLSTSLKTGGALLELPPSLIPNPARWRNYLDVWIDQDFLRYTVNSVFITALQLIGTLLSCALIGYGLAMFKFKLGNIIFMAMVATLIMPGQITLIPTYFIWKLLGGLDSYYPLIVPGFLGQAFGIFLMRQFFLSLPRGLYEAAYVDGANPFHIFWRIYLPLATPALGTLTIFTFMGAWNNTMGPLIYLQTRELFTLPLALLFLQGDVYTDTTVVMAGAVITTIPVLIVYLSAQKYFIQGIASTGVKG